MDQERALRALGTEGLTKLMLKYSIPCVLSLLISSMYNIVDQIFIGNSELSALGNAATGVVFPIFVVAQAFAWCFGDGCAAYLSICQGKRDTRNAAKAIGSSLTLTFLSSLLLMAVFYPVKVPLLTLFGASENSLGYAIEYFDVILAFFPFYMLSNMMNSVIRADGSPAWAMVAVITGAVVNLILDPVFIFGLEWGMFGAALATVIGQCASFLVALVYFFRTKTFRLSLRALVPNLRAAWAAAGLGVSTFVTQIAILVVSVACNVLLASYGATSGYGVDVPIAIIGIQSKVLTLVINLVVGIALGCQPIISYNIGARNYPRIKQLFHRILACTVVIGLASTALFELAPRAVVGLFGAPTNIPNPEDYWMFGEKTFRIFLSLTVFTCIVKMTSIFFQAAGRPVRAVAASLVRDIGCFLPLAMLFPALLGGVEGILYAAPAADLVAMAVTAVMAVTFLRGLKETDGEEEAPAVLKPSHRGVILTLSREHGSGGKQIGKLVAERLGIPFYYKEMTALAARESGLDREFLSELNGNVPARLHSLYLSTEVIRQAVVAQDRVIRMIADQGSCVIVGRAADYVLRDYENVVRVFVYASEEYKIQRVMSLYGDGTEEAKRQVRRADDARASYYRSVSEREWGARGNYDLMLDGSMGVDAAVAVILKYLEERAHS